MKIHSVSFRLGCRIYRLIKFIVIFLISTLYTLSSLHAETKYNVVTESLPPYQVLENGVVKGSITTIVKKTLQCAEMTAEYQMLPWNRAFNKAKNTKDTLIYSMARTPERELEFIWIGPVHSTQVNLYKLKSRTDIKINSFNDIKNYRLLLLKGGFIVESFNNANFIEGKHYRLIDSNVFRTKMLFAGRYDLVDYTELQIISLLENTGHTRDQLEIVMPLATNRVLYLAINKHADQKVVDTLRNCLSKHNYKTTIKIK